MRTLLSLPREIRDQIIEYVVLSHKEPPSSPANNVQSRHTPTGLATLRPPCVTQHTYNAFGLLGANVQLRDETRNRLSQIQLAFSLDVMVVDNELWPTWICCPIRAPGPIDTIHVSLRFFSRPNDPFMVHVARTFWAILQGRKWTSTSLHPLAELFLYIRDVCLQPGAMNANLIKILSFNVSTANHLDEIPDTVRSGSLSNLGLKSLFGKHRSLWNSFRSIHQYPFASNSEVERLDPVASLKILIILILQESWEDECAMYASYVGPLGSAFRSLQSIKFAVDGQEIGQLTARVSLV